MQAVLNGLVLEVNKNEKEGKTYQSLVVFEPGQKFPEIKKVSFDDQHASAAASLVGKRASITCNIFTYKERVSLTFDKGTPLNQ